MSRSTVVYKKLGEVFPYEKNPRKNDDAVKYVVESIKEFGFLVPVVISKENVIVAGHTRYKAAKEMELEEIPCIIADDLTPEQIKAFRLADNKTAEMSEWDGELLGQELLDILDIDMGLFGFEDFGSDGEEGEQDSTYSMKVSIPQYEITGECPDISDMLDTGKSEQLIEEIQKADITDEEKEFLMQAARRHNVFNYRNIAEYYAHATPEMQRLMEKSALVIIDVGDAIANGYASLFEDVEDAIGENLGGGYNGNVH